MGLGRPHLLRPPLADPFLSVVGITERQSMQIIQV